MEPVTRTRLIAGAIAVILLAALRGILNVLAMLAVAFITPWPLAGSVILFLVVSYLIGSILDKYLL